jgi:hypothetical protein
MSAQAARRLDQSTIVSTNPGRNYEVVGEVRVSSAADIAVAVRQARGAIYAVIRTSLVICLALFTYLANGYA